MRRTVTMHCVVFDVDFTVDGETEALYIAGQDVTDVIREVTKDALRSLVERNAKTWFDEYLREAAAEELMERRAA